MNKIWYLPFIAFGAFILLVQTGHAQVVINEFSAANYSEITDNYGEYSDWVELYNAGGASVDMSGYYLSDKMGNPTKWTFPSGITIAAGAYKLIWLTGRDEYSGGYIHTNFKITQCKPSEAVVLADPSGTIIDSNPISATNQKNNSRGRSTDGGATWAVFTTPTPGFANANPKNEYTPKPILSLVPGYYTGTQSLTITDTDPNAVIHYTTNGNAPTSASATYSAALTISATEVVRAIAVDPDPLTPPSFVETNTYFINETHTVSIISICGDQVDDLLNGGWGNPTPDGSFELFDAQGNLIDEGTGDFNKHGNDSWAYAQRGFDYVMTDEYGYNYALRDQIFPGKTRDEFQRVIVKAAANDNYPFGLGFGDITGPANIRDSYVEQLSQEAHLHLDTRTYKACVVYLNGAYWGVYDLREKVDDADYTKYYYNQDRFNLQMLKTWGGTWSEYGGTQAQTDWDNLKNFILSNNMALPNNWAYVDSVYNWKSLVDYVCLNSYCVTTDWLNWNTQWYRGMNPLGDKKKWNYCLWDEDATFGHYINYTGVPSIQPDADPCNPETLPDPGGQGHIPILNALKNNPIFFQYYVSRYIDLGNTYLGCDFMIPFLDTLINGIDPEMQEDVNKWGGSYSGWQANVQQMRDFINARCVAMDTGMVNCYALTGPWNVTFDVVPANMGNGIKINSIQPSTYPFVGDYFGQINILMKAKAAAGYVFDHWESNNNTINPNTTTDSTWLNITTGDTITAYFIPLNNLPAYDLTVNVVPANAGTVVVGGITPPAYPYLTNYTSGQNVTLAENPNNNYVFEFWELKNHLVNPTSTDSSVNFTIYTGDTAIAHFRSLTSTYDGITNSSWFNVYPTIVNSDLTIDYLLTRPMDLQVELYSINGQRAVELLNYPESQVPIGEQKVNVDLQDYDLAPGVYFVRFTTPYGDKNFKIAYIPR